MLCLRQGTCTIWGVLPYPGSLSIVGLSALALTLTPHSTSPWQSWLNIEHLNGLNGLLHLLTSSLLYNIKIQIKIAKPYVGNTIKYSSILKPLRMSCKKFQKLHNKIAHTPFSSYPSNVKANITANIACTILHLNSEPWLLKSWE